MLFNSMTFLVFFPLVALVYWHLPYRFRNFFLLGASYYFYMSWNVFFGLLILFSTGVTFLAARLLRRVPVGDTKGLRWNRGVLGGCLSINLGLLFLFKYMGALGLHWLLPVGISFYTFQAVGYTIDVYRGTICAERDFTTYALFVSFFPQLVAGPIERASHLLPQFHRPAVFDGWLAMRGIELMAWGFFMKLCVADRAALYVDAVFNHLGRHGGASVTLASFLFTMQIYGDFCGYSLIAIGAARVLGFDLMENFHRPYWSMNVQQFWRRWHISLSTWFMDYVYIPLGGSRCSLRRHLFNLLLTFVVSGMWHGAHWTFVLWGAYHGLLLVGYVLWRRLGPKVVLWGPLQRVLNGVFTFALVALGWVFFRANSVDDAFVALHKIFAPWGDLFIDFNALVLVFVALLLLGLKELTEELFPVWVRAMQWKHAVACYFSVALVVVFILSSGVLDGGAFIYFQF